MSPSSGIRKGYLLWGALFKAIRFHLGIMKCVQEGNKAAVRVAAACGVSQGSIKVSRIKNKKICTRRQDQGDMYSYERNPLLL